MKKTAIVTGVSNKKGIGFAICKKLLEEGYFVNALYNSTNECEQKFKSNNSIKFFQCDFTDRESLKSLIIKFSTSKIDLLVNNAGKFLEEKDYLNYDMSSWDEVFDVNVRAPMALSTGLANSFNSNGVIINICSTDGFTGAFSSMSYAASKAALSNLTKSLAINFGFDDRKIRVVGVAPGWVNSTEDMVKQENNEDSNVLEISEQLTPLGRNGSTSEVADLVSYLASDNARFITGNTIIIDGGYSLIDYGLMREEGKKVD